jgi:CubicO group peptidase (beta-lactamase class C family)
LFQVGSTTKAFTTAALSVLVEDGLLRWDDAVIDYLPDFQLQDPWLTRHLTIRDTVTHRSGISGSLYPFLAIMDSHHAVRQLRYVTPEAAFRDSYRYSNLMYAVAGEVLEKASGKTWSDFIRSRLLRPLNMNRSGTSPYGVWDPQYVTPTFFGSIPAALPDPTKARDTNVALPHGWGESGAPIPLPWRSYDNAAPAGALVSSAADMANWLILHLNGGRFAGQQILKEETVGELHATQNPHNDGNPSPFDPAVEQYAAGWRRATYRGHTRLAHGGGIIGFPSYVALLPEKRIGVVVLSNGPMLMRGTVPEYLPHKCIAFWVFDRLLDGAPSQDWAAICLSGARKLAEEGAQKEESLRRSRLPNASPSLPLDRYAGTYEDRKGQSGRVKVTAAAGQLTISFKGEGAFSAHLEHWHGDLFRLRAEPAVAHVFGPQFVSFTVDALGQATSLTLFGATLERLPTH